MPLQKFFICNENVRQNCIKQIQELPLDKYEVQIRPAKRSNLQNSLYWMWVNAIALEQGDSKNNVHDMLKAHILGTEEITTSLGNHLIIPKSSSKLNKKEFAEYLNKVEIVADFMGINLPDKGYFGL